MSPVSTLGAMDDLWEQGEEVERIFAILPQSESICSAVSLLQFTFVPLSVPFAGDGPPIGRHSRQEGGGAKGSDIGSH